MNYIWFDLGYTLVHTNREERFQLLLEKSGIHKSADEIALAYHLADKYFMRELPGVLGRQFHKYAGDYQKLLCEFLAINPESIEKSTAETPQQRMEWRAFPHTIPTLQILRERGYGIGLISNWDQTAKDVLAQTGIDSYLDHKIISSEIQIEKPDQQIFWHALEKAGVSAAESIYIGDNYYDDVVGSRRVGMESILINPFGKQGIEEIEGVPIITNIGELLEILDLPLKPVY
ncbi:putative hydrolase of the HAD superfamily [Bacillus oleivorans]|uniref:Putative hydrolase of the HAD superfamily n=1 Tax=Bacillus oleivorans TaxID=1448271 RepID=A0A285D5R2_9BACI|nr:HAD family hydrolase [Bacillus oleivorans]SNX74686.1 putative hydrolase of the HAD superfamily [Bacillus oleivorans]